MTPAQTLSATLPQLQSELCLGAGVVAVLLSEVLLTGRNRAATGWIAACFSLLAGILALRAPAALPGVDSMLCSDGASAYLKALFAFSALAVSLLTLRSREAALLPAGEFHAFLLSAALGCSLLASARNLVLLYVAMEIVSYGSYLLAGFLRRDLRSNEAALKYVLYGAVASAVMLYGISLLYGMGRTLDLPALGAALCDARAPAGLCLPFGMVLVGLGFKVAAAPFHQWAPDVYEGAPTPVSAFLSVAPKVAGLAALARLVLLGFSSGGAVAVHWPAVLGVLAALTMTVGNLCALFQTNVKRMLAYSSVAHAGYMLMALATGRMGLQALLFYAAVYAFMNLGAFGAAMAFSRITGSEELSAWRGLGWRHRLLGACMVVFLMSLTGVPPFAGFVGKLLLFKAALAAAPLSTVLAGGAESPMRWMYVVIALGLLNSVVSLVYYVSVAKALFLEKGAEGGPEGSAGWLQPLVVLVLAAATLVLGIFPGALDAAAAAAAASFGPLP